MVRIERCNPEYSAYSVRPGCEQTTRQAQSSQWVLSADLASPQFGQSFPLFSPPHAWTTFRSPAAAAFFFLRLLFLSLPTTSSLTSFLNLILSQSSSIDAIPQAKQRPVWRYSTRSANLQLSVRVYHILFVFDRHESLNSTANALRVCPSISPNFSTHLSLSFVS